MSGDKAFTARTCPPASLKGARILKLGESAPAGILASAAIMLALSFAVNLSGVPNPNMVLISGLVICSAMFGYRGGITGAIIMAAYTLAFFSTGHDFVTFTDENLQKVIVSMSSIAIVTLFVSGLRHVISKAFMRLEALNRQLEEDNHLLEEASAVDSLTGTRNRFGLRRDFADYSGRDLHVMMLDIDNFKALNDTYGHQVGDNVLVELGRILMDLFSHNHVYRYGGDEFLVICPDMPEQEFEHKTAQLTDQLAAICVDGCNEPVLVSAGYVYGTSAQPSILRLMIGQADAILYSSKNAGKNRIVGRAFCQAEAASINLERGGARGYIGQRRSAGRTAALGNSSICTNNKTLQRALDIQVRA